MKKTCLILILISCVAQALPKEVRDLQLKYDQLRAQLSLVYWQYAQALEHEFKLTTERKITDEPIKLNKLYFSHVRRLEALLALIEQLELKIDVVYQKLCAAEVKYKLLPELVSPDI